MAASLCGCGGSQAPLPQTAADEVALARNFRTLHIFKGGPDGADPYAAMLYFDGALYGTTVNGGNYNEGTVFRVTPDGRERVVHSFGATGDGVQPYGGLIAVHGMLYGTTRLGGSGGNGTFYRISPSGIEKVIYGFTYRDGSEPEGAPVELNREFYGTTVYGGAYDYGAVWRIVRSGREQVLYSFGATREDGAYPISGLTVLHRKFYGVTVYGGKFGACGQGCGTVFSVDLSGKEEIVHRFSGLSYDDGYYPMGSLTTVGGVLYGTTIYGGRSGGYGTVFAATTSGYEKVVLSFADLGSLGVFPYAGLVAINGALYGTTETGGAYNFGTVFKTTTSGQPTLLHSFKGRPGENPYATLIDIDGSLYGTASAGGAAGAGTIFRVLP